MRLTVCSPVFQGAKEFLRLKPPCAGDTVQMAEASVGTRGLSPRTTDTPATPNVPRKENQRVTNWRAQSWVIWILSLVSQVLQLTVLDIDPSTWKCWALPIKGPLSRGPPKGALDLAAWGPHKGPFSNERNSAEWGAGKRAGQSRRWGACLARGDHQHPIRAPRPIRSNP